MVAVSQIAQQLLQEIAWLVLFRAAPFVVWSLGQARVRLRSTMLSLGLYVSCAMLAARGTPASVVSAVFEAGLVHGYMVVLALVVFQLSKLFASGHISRPAAAATCVALYGVLGRHIYPEGAGLAVTVLGWERMLGAYSYIVDGGHGGKRHSLSDGVFFLVVSPMLVYPERGARLAGSARIEDTLRRVLAALVLLSLHVVLARTVDDLPRWRSLAGGAGTTVSVLYLMAWGASVYVLQAGIATLSIGWMGLLGWSIPERYVAPLLSRSPVELWQRWNTYFGSWIRRYVFYPLTRYFMRTGRLPPTLAQGLAICLSFATVGVFHDASLFAQQARFAAPIMTALFVAHALWIIAWRLATARRTELATNTLNLRSRVLGFLALQPGIVLTELVALPALAGERVVLDLHAVLWP